MVHKIKSTAQLDGLITNDSHGFYNPFIMLIVSYETKLKILEGNIDKYAKKIVTMKKDIKQSIDEQNRLTNTLERKTDQLAENRDGLLKTCEEPYEDIVIRDFNQNILNLQAKNDQLMSEIEDCNALRTAKMEEIEQKKELIEHLELNKDPSDTISEEMDIRLATRQKKDMEHELIILEDKVIALRNQKLLVETEVFEKQRESETLKFKMTTLEKERQAELNKISNKKEKLENDYKEVRAEFDALCRKYRESLEVLNDKKSFIEQLNQELIAKNEKITYLKKLKADLISSLERTNFDLSADQENRTVVLETLRKHK